MYILGQPLTQLVIQGDYIDYTGNNGCIGNACIGCNALSPSSSQQGTPGSKCNNTDGCHSDYYGYYNSYGWRVAYIERNGTPDNYLDDSVYITTCGSPECVKKSYNLNSDAIKYCNFDYVYKGECNSNSVWNMNQTDFQKLLGNTSVSSVAYGLNNVIIDIGGMYWYSPPILSA